MANGTVKWFNSAKGYGFIQPDDGGPDVFVHVAAVERSGLDGLQEGQLVSYELERDRRSGKTSAGSLQITGQGERPQGDRSHGGERSYGGDRGYGDRRHRTARRRAIGHLEGVRPGR